MNIGIPYFAGTAAHRTLCGAVLSDLHSFRKSMEPRSYVFVVKGFTTENQGARGEARVHRRQLMSEDSQMGGSALDETEFAGFERLAQIVASCFAGQHCNGLAPHEGMKNGRNGKVESDR